MDFSKGKMSAEKKRDLVLKVNAQSSSLLFEDHKDAEDHRRLRRPLGVRIEC